MRTLNWLFFLVFLFQNWNGFPSVNSTRQANCNTPSYFSVRFHPDDRLRVGDLVSFDVSSTRKGIDFSKQKLVLEIGNQEIATAGFGNVGEGSYRSVMQWAWDTKGLSPGIYQLTISIMPAGITWTQQVPLLEPVADANSYQWKTSQTDCCEIHYISNTAAERDLKQLLPIIETKAEQAAAAMYTTLPSLKFAVNLIPRNLGHGGFTTDEIFVSYPDHPYTGADFSQVLEHEMIHLLDAGLGGEYRPILLVEGLAVFTTGGHYKKEPLVGRAAALYRLGWYIPLNYLANNFYPSQHEIGYLEASTVVAYMVDTWGRDAFSNFYRDIQASKGGDSDAIDNALQRHFSISFKQLEDRYISMLNNQPVNPDLMMDVRYSTEIYDTLRYYQQSLDPSAYYRQLWIPSGKDSRSRQIVGDYLRHPEGHNNKEIENLFANTSQALRAGQYTKIEGVLHTIQQRLLKLPLLNCPVKNSITLLLN